MIPITSRVISIFNRKTSMRLSPAEWDAIDEICKREDIKRKNLLELIEANHNTSISLTYAVKLFMIIYYHKSVLNQNKKHPISNLSPIFEAIKGIV